MEPIFHDLSFIIPILLFQIGVTLYTCKKTKSYQCFFSGVSDIKINDNFILEVPQKSKKYFHDVIQSTNDFLQKNKETSADFSLIKDICERQLEKFDNEIANLINIPLYIGLGGTFWGIILGIGNITTDLSATGEGINPLLSNVRAAMCTSLAGLGCTIVLSLYYKYATFKNDTEKNNYYDFLQRELLPDLYTSVARSLGILKDVLTHFIREFKDNMDIASGKMLSENLNAQRLVLEEINKINLSNTASKIVETFSKLNESSQHLEKFLDYQKSLNNCLDRTEEVTEKIRYTIDKFDDFNLNLKEVVTATKVSTELHEQFKNSLEQHFPTIEDHRQIWRKHIDELNHDVGKAYKGMYDYFEKLTEQVKEFVENEGNENIKKAIDIIVSNSTAQKEIFLRLQQENIQLREDFQETRTERLEIDRRHFDIIENIIESSDRKSIEMVESLRITIEKINKVIDKIGR